MAKVKRVVKSLYTPDGKYIKGGFKASTVSGLIKALQQLPAALPLNETYYLTWVNVGHKEAGSEESLMISEDNVFDDDEDE